MQCQTYNLEVPKPVFNFETTTETLYSPGPSESQKLDSALAAPEHCYDARPTPESLEIQEADAVTNPSPNPRAPNTQEFDVAAGPASDPFPTPFPFELSTGPPKSEEFNIVAGPVPESLEHQEADAVTNPCPNPRAPNTQEFDVAAGPASDPFPTPFPLELSTGPPKSQEFNFAAGPVPEFLESLENQEANAATNPFPTPFSFELGTGPPKSQESNVAARPAPEPLTMSTARSENPMIRKIGAKRQRSGDAGVKARLVPQDILTTRVAIQEKDHMIELLKNQVSD
jgi:hypothetical protein